MIDGLLQHGERASGQHLGSHAWLDACRHENERDAARRTEFGLELGAGRAGHADINDETRSTVEGVACDEQRIGRRKRFDDVPRRPEKTSQRLAHVRIVIDDTNHLVRMAVARALDHHTFV